MAAVWFVVTIPSAKCQLSKSLKSSESGPCLSTKDNRVSDPDSRGVTFDTGSVTGTLTSKERSDDVSAPDEVILRISGDKRTESGASGRNEQLAETSAEQVLDETLKSLGIDDVVWNPSKDKNSYQVTFCARSEDCENILHTLTDVGLGLRPNTSLSVIPCTIHYDSRVCNDSDETSDGESSSETETHITGESKALRSNTNTTGRRKFMQSVKSRLTVAQVVEGVRASASLTFDFIMFVILAGLLAALGLVENSSVVLVASMLVSPMMGPILAGTFGTVIQDRSLRRLGVRNELIGLSICLSFGFLFGIIYGLSQHWHESFLLTDEMVARGQLRSLWVGALIAIPSGAGVALSVLGGNAGSLVGVAISASLLPPVVNAGLLWAIALTKIGSDEIDPTASNPYKPTYSNNIAVEASILGAVSLCLTIVNIICIFIMGVIVLKVKEVAPKGGLQNTGRFWHRDVRVTRDYNKTHGPIEGSSLAERFMEEWVALSKGRASPNSQMRGLNSLQRCMEDLDEDPVYRTVYNLTTYRAPLKLSHMTWHRSPYERNSGFPQEGLQFRRSQRYQRSISTPSDADFRPRRIASGTGAPHNVVTTPTEKSPGKRSTWAFSLSKPAKHRFIVTKAEDNRSNELKELA